MSIYEKLLKARIELHSTKLKKTGKNAFSGYDYFELEDIMPKILELMDKYKFIGIVSYTNELATLTLLDCEKPEDKIIFTSPMSTANLKGCHDVQNLGAVETYERRYLYITAFEIIENDILDRTHNKNETEWKVKSASTTMKSGKYAGKTIEEIYAIDKDYIKWLYEKADKPEIKTEIERLRNAG